MLRVSALAPSTELQILQGDHRGPGGAGHTCCRKGDWSLSNELKSFILGSKPADLCPGRGEGDNIFIRLNSKQACHLLQRGAPFFLPRILENPWRYTGLLGSETTLNAFPSSFSSLNYFNLNKALHNFLPFYLNLPASRNSQVGGVVLGIHGTCLQYSKGLNMVCFKVWETQRWCHTSPVTEFRSISQKSQWARWQSCSAQCCRAASSGESQGRPAALASSSIGWAPSSVMPNCA